MKIISCGLEWLMVVGVKRLCVWVKVDLVAGPIAICVNDQIMPNTVSSDDEAIFTAELPTCIAFSGEKISLQLISIKTGELSPVINLQVEPVNFSDRKGKGKHVLISSFPKSGSTFLLRLLTNFTGFVSYPLVYEYGGNEQDLYHPAIVDSFFINTITQQHTRATNTNIKLISDYQFDVVILTRNIFDTLVSLHDHLVNESYEIPLLFVDRDFELLKFDERIDMLIDLAAPWYIDFYASWFKRAACLENNNILWLAYEDLIGDVSGSIKKVIDRFDLKPVSSELIGLDNVGKIISGGTRLNVGRVGRGAELLSGSQKERVVHLMRHHPEVDFSKIL